MELTMNLKVFTLIGVIVVILIILRASLYFTDDKNTLESLQNHIKIIYSNNNGNDNNKDTIISSFISSLPTLRIKPVTLLHACPDYAVTPSQALLIMTSISPLLPMGTVTMTCQEAITQGTKVNEIARFNFCVGVVNVKNPYGSTNNNGVTEGFELCFQFPWLSTTNKLKTTGSKMESQTQTTVMNAWSNYDIDDLNINLTIYGILSFINFLEHCPPSPNSIPYTVGYGMPTNNFNTIKNLINKQHSGLCTGIKSIKLPNGKVMHQLLVNPYYLEPTSTLPLASTTNNPSKCVVNTSIIPCLKVRNAYAECMGHLGRLIVGVMTITNKREEDK